MVQESATARIDVETALYGEIDAILFPWADQNGFVIQTDDRDWPLRFVYVKPPAAGYGRMRIYTKGESSWHPNDYVVVVSTHDHGTQSKIMSNLSGLLEALEWAGNLLKGG